MRSAAAEPMTGARRVPGERGRRMAACALLAGVLAGGGCGTGRDGRLAAADGGTRDALLGRIDATLTLAIEQSRLAATQASDPDLRRFAAAQVARYTGIRTELRAMAHDEPETAPLVATLAPQQSRRLEELRTTRGAQFDRAYVHQALAVHRHLLGELDLALQRARDDDVRQALRELREGVPGRATAPGAAGPRAGLRAAVAVGAGARAPVVAGDR